MAMSLEFKLGIAVTLFITVAAASSAPWWWRDVDRVQAPPGSDVVGMSGGCPPFQLFAQNRWAPVGTPHPQRSTQPAGLTVDRRRPPQDRKSTRLNSSHSQ